MLSRDAYDVASVIISGGLTVHDLKASIISAIFPPHEIDKRLHDSLLELCNNGMLEWTFEPDYGNTPSQQPPSMTAEEFEKFWQMAFPHGGPSDGIPSKENRTLFLEDNDKLTAELAKSEYETLMD